MYEELAQIKDEFPYNHYFIYNNKKYPFIFDLFMGYSKYFTQNHDELEKTKFIQLIDEHTDVTIKIEENVIESFINFVHRQPITLNKENVSILNYLGNKYMIDPLIKITEKYIDKHQRELVINILLIHQNDPNFETKSFEKILSKNWLEYIHDGRLLGLNFPILYRILTNIDKRENNQEMIEFYFKCLDKFGREASILFQNIDFQYLNAENLNRLMTKYSKIFDFHFINSLNIKTIYEMQNEFHIKIEEEKSKRKELENIIKEIKQSIELFQKNAIQIQDRQEKEIQLLKSQNNELYKQIDKLKNIIDYEKKI